jgi:uncharacterized protein (TIGR02246 family)
MTSTMLSTVLAVALTVGGAFAQAPGADDQALTALVTQLIDAQMRYDAAALDRLFATDYIEISPLGEFDPRDKVLTFYAPSEKPDPTKMSMSAEAAEHSIRSDGKTAIVIARLNFSITLDGKALPPRSLRATFVMRKDGEAWKFASAQYTSIRPQ